MNTVQKFYSKAEISSNRNHRKMSPGKMEEFNKTSEKSFKSKKLIYRSSAYSYYS